MKRKQQTIKKLKAEIATLKAENARLWSMIKAGIQKYEAAARMQQYLNWVYGEMSKRDGTK